VSAYTEVLIEQGATFSTTVNVEDTSGSAVNLSGYSASSQMRKSYYSSTYSTIQASVTGTSNGEITLSMTSANTANLAAGRYVFDLVITASDTTKTRVVEGIVVVSPGVTR
tara:strand:+ start:763 stop:1095 length:333 start_codon:yes stop_codon:yes gene_type:complete